MKRRSRDFGRTKLLAVFLFVSVFLLNVINAFNSNATGALGSFEANETGIKLCAQINAGPEESMRFLVNNDQGFSSDLIVENNTCKNIKTVAATYTIRHFLPQEYTIEEVSGGTVSADNVPFVTTASGQYSIIYNDTYNAKGYLHSFGYTLSNQVASAIDVHFDANGGEGSMNTQRFGLNTLQTLEANAFTWDKHRFLGWNTEADGSGVSYTNEQQISFAEGGEIVLYAQWESRIATDIIARQASYGSSYVIDFTRKAIVSDDAYEANGNGVNKYTEKGQDVYYYRGELNNNNVVWANKCWKIVRTTYSGGTKMIYNGETSDVIVDGATVKQCLATGVDTQISVNVGGVDKNIFQYNSNYSSPADVGYMYGERIEFRVISTNNTNYVFSNNVSRSGNTYTLDTASGQSISGTWESRHNDAAVRYHYFCTDGQTRCSSDKIGYIVYFDDGSRLSYLNIAGYDDIEAAKTAMFANETDSNAKAMVETWFEQQNLDGHIVNTRNYENDLEDAIFCNDRSYYSGSLKGKDSNAAADTNTSIHGPYARNVIKNASNNLDPLLDCINQNDAFTKDDNVNGNAKLKHKIGLITDDELTMAGTGRHGNDSTAYLYSGEYAWTISPFEFDNNSSNMFRWYVGQGAYDVDDEFALRPLVSLKAGIEFMGGTGLSTDPYIVE